MEHLEAHLVYFRSPIVEPLITLVHLQMVTARRGVPIETFIMGCGATVWVSWVLYYRILPD